MRLLSVSALESRPAAETLLGLRGRGIDLEVVAPKNAGYAALVRDAGCPLTLVSGRRRSASVARDRIRRCRADLLHVEALEAPAPVLLAARGTPAQIVARVLYLESNRHLARLARLLCRSPRVARILADVDPQAFGDTATARALGYKTSVIPQGHDPGWYSRDHDLTALGVPPGAFSVGAVSDGSTHEGMERLIRCARRLPMDLPIHFLLLAPVGAHELLRRQIRKIPFTQRFHLLDAVSGAPGLLACCSVLVLTDWDMEIQRRSCMHCLVSGVPVLAEELAPLTQVIHGGKNGELVPPGDMQALAEILFDLYETPERRAALSAGAARLAAASPSVEDAVTRSVSVFQEILAAGGAHMKPAS